MKLQAAVLVLGCCLAFWAGRGSRAGPAAAQDQPWSSLRLTADPAIVATVLRAVRLPDGTVVNREQLAYIGPLDEDRVRDVVLEPGYQYGCDATFNFNDPVEYDDTLFLPFLWLRPRR